MPLIEKAYAKLHGCFEVINGGSMAVGMVDVSGGVEMTVDGVEQKGIKDCRKINAFLDEVYRVDSHTRTSNSKKQQN